MTYLVKIRGAAPFFFLAAAAFILFGCSMGGPGVAVSPEQAVRDAIRRDADNGGVPIDLATVRFRHTQALDQRVFYLLTFTSTIEGQLTECLYVYEAYPRRNGWVVSGGGGGCSPAGGAAQHGGGQGSTSDGLTQFSSTHVHGQALNPEIVAVEVDWADGQVQREAVVNGVYLILRNGLHDHGDIRFLNAAGETLETLSSEKAPGKK